MNLRTFFTPTLIFLMISLIGLAQDTTLNWRVYPTKKAAPLVKPVMVDSNFRVLDFSKTNGKVQVFGDEQINLVSNSFKESPYIFGYTVQLAVSANRNEIKSARYKILKIDNDIELSDPYVEPNIYLYAGRFYTKEDAYAFKHQISGSFPNAIVIGPRQMELPVIQMPEVIIPNDSLTTPRN